MSEYNVDYFIKKFEAIPESEIGSGLLSDHCALWHCGMAQLEEETPEALALGTLLQPLVSEYGSPHPIKSVWLVNDGVFDGPSAKLKPKTRILQALEKIKTKSAQ